MAQNVILTTTNAYIEDSAVTSSFGKVDISAASTSVINATVVAASVAVAGGGKAGVGASIGISVARNLIGYDTDYSSSPAEVRALVKDSSVHALGGGLTQTALAEQTIHSVVIAASVAVGVGGKAGVAVSGSGVSFRSAGWVERCRPTMFSVSSGS